MPSLADLQRSWLLKLLGLSSSTQSETTLRTQLYGDTSFNAGVRRVNTSSYGGQSGKYFFPVAGHTSGSSSTLNNGVLRILPWVLEEQITIARIGAEIIGAGDAGSTLRHGIYASDQNNQPSTLVVDAGTTPADAVGVAEVVLGTPLTLGPGVYWIGSALQGVTTTQPSVRTVNAAVSGLVIMSGTAIPAANASTLGYSMAGVTGALPTTFVVGSAIGGVPRLFAKLS